MKSKKKIVLWISIAIGIVIIVPGTLLLVYVLSVPSENRLNVAAGNDDLATVKELKNKGASLDGQEKGMLGRTPLITASVSDGTNVFFYLLSAGANVNARDREGKSALMAAVMLGDANLLKIEALIAAGADINARNNSGSAVLKYAKDASLGHAAMRTIDLLEQRGARE